MNSVNDNDARPKSTPAFTPPVHLRLIQGPSIVSNPYRSSLHVARQRAKHVTITPRRRATMATDTPEKKTLSLPNLVLLAVSTVLSSTFSCAPPCRAVSTASENEAVALSLPCVNTLSTSDSSTDDINRQPLLLARSITSSSPSSSSSFSSSSPSSSPSSFSTTTADVTVTTHEEQLVEAHSLTHYTGVHNDDMGMPVYVETNSISLESLGIKTEEFLSQRELRRRKTTQFSEAEQEIMELEEWEVDTQWFRDLQAMWAALFSVGGIFVLYRGGQMWEKWIKEQEKKDMEEEIELTGTFIDPRAVRKDEDDNNGGGDKGKDKKNKKPPSSPNSPGDADSPSGGVETSSSSSSSSSSSDELKQGDIESLEKLFGKS